MEILVNQYRQPPQQHFSFRFYFYLQRFSIVTILIFFCLVNKAQLLKGFNKTGFFDEQESTITGQWENVVISINAPLKFTQKGKTFLIFYALPNGNTIEWTKGKKISPGDDWHFDIQHIAAQTRFVRNLDNKNNYIIAYLMAVQKSWPTWKHNTPDANKIIKAIIEQTTKRFQSLNPSIILNGHSGGGSFIFGMLDASPVLPLNIERIAFLDSDYGYEDSLHTGKLINWLNSGKKNKLVVLAYNDSLVIYNGKPLVSPTGGTWYRSRRMQRKLSCAFQFTTISDTSFIDHEALNGRIKIILKQNQYGLILHTEQVAKNGFILSLLAGTKFFNEKYFRYFGESAYKKYISDQ